MAAGESVGRVRDPNAECSYEIERVDDGDTNGVTGFRAVLEDTREPE